MHPYSSCVVYPCRRRDAYLRRHGELQHALLPAQGQVGFPPAGGCASQGLLHPDGGRLFRHRIRLSVRSARPCAQFRKPQRFGPCRRNVCGFDMDSGTWPRMADAEACGAYGTVQSTPLPSYPNSSDLIHPQMTQVHGSRSTVHG